MVLTVNTTEWYVHVLLMSDPDGKPKWFRTTIDKLDVPDFHFNHSRYIWQINEEVFPGIYEVIQVEQNKYVYVTTKSSALALKYKLMLG